MLSINFNFNDYPSLRDAMVENSTSGTTLLPDPTVLQLSEFFSKFFDFFFFSSIEVLHEFYLLFIIRFWLCNKTEQHVKYSQTKGMIFYIIYLFDIAYYDIA